jgi:predicted O-linked N-acetylglucosamine transferase (SPINDLY family)
MDAHLARHAHADLFLDTFHCNGHTTTSDAVWMGVPVLTWPSATFAGRVSASLLSAIGLDELIAANPQAYEALAVALARDAAGLAGVKAKLQANRGAKPLFDTVGFTRHLETAYLGMWGRTQRGLPPVDITVSR